MRTVEVRMGDTAHDVLLIFHEDEGDMRGPATFKLRWLDDVNADECARCRSWLRSRLRREGLKVADGD